MSETMTIAICSHQRREPLVRLLRALADQAVAAPASWSGIDVVVAIDGSTDGSDAAARAVVTPFPLTISSQPHRGLSAARNECLARASGTLIYFLDDDLVPAEGTVERHRSADRSGPARILLGPCVIPRSFPAPESARAWRAGRYAELERTQVIDRFDRFSIANSSGPTAVFRAVGGFDPTFVGYGLEDYEMGLRLMESGVYERFDPSAIAWHYSTSDERSDVRRHWETGQNTVRLLRRHPGVADTLFPSTYRGPAPWILDRLGIRRPTLLRAVATSCHCVGRHVPARPRRIPEFIFALALAAAFSAGVAELDPSLVSRSLGRPKEPTVRAPWWRHPTSTVRKPQ